MKVSATKLIWLLPAGLLLVVLAAVWIYRSPEATISETARQEVQPLNPSGEAKPEAPAPDQSASRPFTVTPLEADGQTRITLHTPELIRETISEGTVLRLPHEAGLRKPGEPELPSMVHVVQGRHGQNLKVQVEDTVYQDFADVKVAPGQRTAWRTKDGKQYDWETDRPADPAIYQEDAFWPPELVVVEEAYAGDRKFARVQYNPVQYNPVTGTLRYHEQINSTLSFAPEAEVAGLQLTLQSEGETTESDCDCSQRINTPDELLPPMAGQAGDFAERRSGAGVNACVKIRITGKQGLYKLTQSALVAAGVDPADLTGSQLRMYHRDREMAIWVSTEGVFNTSDYVLFYAEGFDGYYTQDNYVWLGFGGSGLRMTERAAPYDTGGGATLVPSACLQQTQSAFNVYDPFENINDDRFDGWFMGQFGNFGPPANLPIEYGFSFRTHHANASQNASFGVLIRGDTDDTTSSSDHRARIGNYLNQVCGIFDYDGKDYFSGTYTFSATRFHPSDIFTGFKIFGDNPENLPFELSFLDTITLEYDRFLYAHNNALGFGGISGLSNYEVKNLSASSGNYVLDVSDPAAPCLLTGVSTVSESGTYTLKYGENLGYDPCYYVAGPAALYQLNAADVEIVQHRDLADTTRRADYIMIVPDNAIQSAYGIAQHRVAKGHDVLVVPVGSIYNEFGYGVKDPLAIKQFVGYAYHHWERPPEYVVLVGDATYDPLHHLEPNATDFIPSPFGPTSFFHSALDMWYGAVNGNDNLIDVAVGRLPITSDTHAVTVLNKMTAYETGLAAAPAWSRKAALIADDGSLFKVDAELIRNEYLPGNFTVLTGYADDVGVSGAHTATLQGFNNQYRLINYNGHGASDQWAVPAILTNTDVDALNNTITPLVGIFTCANGIFHQPPNICTVEKLLQRNNGGAVAVLAPTAYSLENVARKLSTQYYNALLNDKYVTGYSIPDFTVETRNETTVGKAFMNGMTAVWMVYGSAARELQFYNFFGDPGLIASP